jgi:tRNA(Arg) A34 adenosine deaminase TadA
MVAQDTHQPEQWAWDLGARTGTDQERIAFLSDGQTVLFARERAPEPWAPSSPVVRLVQGLYERFPERARKLARNRIYDTGEPGLICRETVHVAAKRITGGIVPHDHGLRTGLVQVDLSDWDSGRPPLAAPEDALRSWPGAKPPSSPRDFLRLATILASRIPRSGPLHGLDRPVAALLVSPEGRLQAWALNTNARNRTLHAEINLVQGFYREARNPFPRGSRLYVTLKPCRMCAALIWQLARRDRDLRVLYAEDDPGPNARGSILEKEGLLVPMLNGVKSTSAAPGSSSP